MKVIDLLNKIANDTLADETKVIIDNVLYIYDQKTKQLLKGYDSVKCRVFDGKSLNEIVEIIPVMEEKNIEELDDRYFDEINQVFCGKRQLGETILIDKINELVGKVNKLKVGIKDDE